MVPKKQTNSREDGWGELIIGSSRRGPTGGEAGIGDRISDWPPW